MNEHVRLRDILHREFTRLAERDGRSAFTDRQKAEQLGISAPHLSYLLKGSRRLTSDVADKIALRLGADDGAHVQRLRDELAFLHQSPTSLREFEDRLLAVARPSELDPRKAGEAFFNLIGGPGWFLCCEYRDLPRATEEYRDLADAAGRAVANGLSFALIQPFGTDFSPAPPGEPSLPRMVQLFMEKLALKVQEVHRGMRRAAERALEGQVSDPTRVARERLVLYERLGRPPVGTGIQSRLFYCENAAGGEMQRGVFEWIAGERGDLFYRRTGPIDVDAFSAQFAPILEFWRHDGANTRLPRTPKEMAQASARAAEHAPGANFPPDLWRVHDP